MNNLKNVKNKLEAMIRRTVLFKENEKVVVGVSGGPDSVALLLILFEMKDLWGLDLLVAHFDHALRSTSRRDALYVKRLAFRLGVPCVLGFAQRGSLSRNGSVEEAARQARLKFLFGAAKNMGATTIALGHNRDDQAETVLMRLVRGAGLQGLSAIMPSRRMGRLRIVRPLLEISRQQINAYLRFKKVTPCIDETNSQEIYMRNKIRKILVPLLEKKFNKNIKEVLSITAGTLGQDYDYMDSVAEKIFRKLKGRLPMHVLTGTHPALVRLLIRKAITRIQGDTRRISFIHIREIEDLIAHRPVGSVVNLPKAVFALKKKRSLKFLKQQR